MMKRVQLALLVLLVLFSASAVQAEKMAAKVEWQLSFTEQKGVGIQQTEAGPKLVYFTERTALASVVGGFQVDFFRDWSAKVFFLVAEKWAEFYGGPIWKFSDWLQAGLLLGLINSSGEFRQRTAVNLKLGPKQLQFSGIWEFTDTVFLEGSDDGFWYDMKVQYQLPWSLTAGLHDRRKVGLGPYLGIKTDFGLGTFWDWTLWLTWPLLESESLVFQPRTVLFGMGMAFHVSGE